MWIFYQLNDSDAILSLWLSHHRSHTQPWYASQKKESLHAPRNSWKYQNFIQKNLTNQDLFVDKNAEIDRQRIYLFPNLKRIEFSEFSDEFFFETIPSQEGFNKFTFLLQPSDAKLLISDLVLDVGGKVCAVWDGIYINSTIITSSLHRTGDNTFLYPSLDINHVSSKPQKAELHPWTHVSLLGTCQLVIKWR